MSARKKTNLVCGVGINDADYVIQRREGGIIAWVCPFYRKWKNLLVRSYSAKYQSNQPTYKGVVCCEEWLTFSNFKRWMETQDWEGKQIDKDILVIGNNVYSTDTCAFVRQATNSFVTDSAASRGMWPIGVSLLGRKFVAHCKNTFSGKLEHLGYFDTPEEAHRAWRKRKHELAQLVAETESDERVKEALRTRYA